MRPASKHQVNSYVRPFLASAMVAGGLLQLAAPIYAAGTAAGADISNTATASYQDPNDTSANAPILNTISNTVSVKVEKVAGITVDIISAIDTTDPGKFKPGDTVNFDFLLTNVGNSAVKFSIPGFATVTNLAGVFQKVQYSTDNGATWLDIDKSTATVPANMPVVPVNGTMKARVIVVVGTVAPGTILNVQLGQTATPLTEAAPTSQNVVRANNGVDVYTIDITDGVTLDPSTGFAVTAGPAINGTREAAALQIVKVSADNKAFADITMTGAKTFEDPTDPTKNKVTYDISVKVDPSAPNIGPDKDKNPTDLAATRIKLDTGSGATSVNRVLISDPVPAGTTPTLLTAPTGWTPVYTLSPAATPVDQIVWKTGPLPTTGAPIISVGFVKNDELPLARNPIPYAGFKVELQTTSATPTAPFTVNNVASVIGTTPLADGTTPDPSKPVVDQTGTPESNSNPTTSNPIVVIFTPNTPLNVFNGPSGKPEASGVGGNQNTDFTNKSAVIALSDAVVANPLTGELKKLSTPLPVDFTNTVENKGLTTTDIYLLPTAPVNKVDLPNSTVVAISFNGDTRTYTYDNVAGKYTPTDLTKLPIVIPLVIPGISNAKDYSVTVTLPANTPQLEGFSVPITAFADTAVPTAGSTTVPTTGSSNTTIDTVYTGYIKLFKEARVLNTAGEAATSTAAFKSGNDLATVKPQPGQVIQYRINYTNISTSGGTDNTVLKAGKLNIVEDGAAGTNTWAAVTNHAAGSASDSKGGKINFFNGAASSSNTGVVSKYVVDMSAASPAVVIEPQGTGTFTFIREVK